MAACATGAPACVEVDQALAFVDGQLGGNARAEIERRIDVCAMCRRLVAEAARSAGAELVRDAHGRSQIVRADDPTGLDGPGSRGGAPRSADSGALQPGEVVGRYVVERALGAGGMGVVSLARDPELRRPVVIKLVHPNMMFGEGGDELEARLRREAQAMAQVSHTNVVQIFDIGRRGERVFLAMEFVAGQTLDAWLAEKPRSVDEILAMFRQAAAGLAAAHRAGLVHRDFKPTNVLVDRDGVAKVTDFGLARALEAGGARATRPMRAPRTSGVHAVLTHADAIVGTPAYMAPEQAAGQPIDARTDQYALAVTLLDALVEQWPTKRKIEPTDAPAEIRDALERRGVAPHVRAAVVRALAADPAARFPTIDDFARALAAPRRRRRWPAITGVGLVAAAVAVWLAVPHRGAACVAKAPDHWSAEQRARLVGQLAKQPRPFASWSAARAAAAIDSNIAALAAAEVAHCQGSASVTEACIDKRIAALDAIPSAPLEDPWPWVNAIAHCDGRPPGANLLRKDLAAVTTPEAARAIAERARGANDEQLAADAYEVAGRLTLPERKATTDTDFLAMVDAGERSGDDAIRGRAFLDLIDAARWRGDFKAAERDAAELEGILNGHAGDPRGELDVALAEGKAFGELGDVARAFAAWDRAADAAKRARDPDAALAAAAGRAWATYTLRWDLAGATTALDAALRAVTAPTPRAAALAIRADLALAAHDGPAAESFETEAERLAPATLAGTLRLRRARALAGDPDAELAALDAMPAPDATSQARIAIARGQILVAAHRMTEAAEILGKTDEAIRYGDKVIALTNQERIDLVVALCEAEDALAGYCKSAMYARTRAADLHPRAPLQAWLSLEDARAPDARQFHGEVRSWLRAADILTEANAEPLTIANLRWQAVQRDTSGFDTWHNARLAHDTFAQAGHTAEVTAIKDWWAAHPPPSYIKDTLDSTPAPTPHGDPWGPQP